MHEDNAHHEHCDSCGMTIESGPYCQYCADENGVLHDFEEQFARMVQFTMRRDDSLTNEQAEAATRDYMATMPAWREHPEIAGR